MLDIIHLTVVRGGRRMAADSTKERILDISLQLFLSMASVPYPLGISAGRVHIKGKLCLLSFLRISGLFWRSWEIGLK